MEHTEFTRKRMTELAEKAYSRGIIFFTDFLNLEEQNILYMAHLDRTGLSVQLSGGYPEAERKMAAFVPDFPSYGNILNEDGRTLLPEDFPFVCVHISPKDDRFAETLGHRDFLGAILSLGIDRAKTGDLLVRENEAYVFISSSMADFLCKNLCSVRRTAVQAVCYTGDSKILQPKKKEITGTVASVRLDAIVSLAFGISRTNAMTKIQGGQVMINAGCITSGSAVPKEGDLISVRGMGKFCFSRILGESRKKRTMILLLLYQ